MAEFVYPPPSGYCMPEGGKYVPDAGMVFDTVELVRVTRVFRSIERPAAWTPEQVRTAMNKRRGDVAASARFYDGDASSDVAAVYLGQYDEDDHEGRPFALSDRDLVEPTAIEVVTAVGGE